MRKPLAQIIPFLAKGVAPTAAVASGLLSPVAFGASGDLDPAFGDVGRVTSALDFAGTAWSVQPLENDASIFAGGREAQFFYSYEHFDEGFEGRLGGAGSLESTFAGVPGNTEVRDVALQSDGKAVAVGRTRRDRRSRAALTVFRLESHGSLDTTFGVGGVVGVAGGEGAQSVTIDPDGRIVVAGTQHDGALMVLRLLANGTLDTTFGTGGIFVGPSSEFAASDRTHTHILRTAGGGYRVSTSACSVVALTAQGTLDTTFGNSGIAALDPPPSGEPIGCSAMVAQANGRLLLAGQEDEHGFAVRLLASGSPDASFNGTTVSSTMADVTALAIDGSGSILVAGRAIESVPAALVMRLQADGTLDGLFGNAGSTWIDLPSDHGLNPVIHDMNVLADGRILAAGGDSSWAIWARPFVARLLGNTGGGPGVLGIQQPFISVDEQSPEAVIPVRRMGGASGEVSVRYQITTSVDSDLPPATPGEDFTPITGRVTWHDGETGDQEIRVPVLPNGAAPESPERFTVTLDDAQGQAGLGTRTAAVDLGGSLSPAGRFGFQTSELEVSEAVSTLGIWVDRIFYSTGAVSVTVTSTSGTASAGADFTLEPITLSWSDGDSNSKLVRININNDGATEPVERFTLQLSNPTGGAFVGPMSTMTVAITDPVQSTSSPGGGGSGGGGALGFLSVLLLGALRLLRTLTRSQT